jgi:hypothetical protein
MALKVPKQLFLHFSRLYLFMERNNSKKIGIFVA